MKCAILFNPLTYQQLDGQFRNQHASFHHRTVLMNSRHIALTAALGFLALCLSATVPLPAAELTTDFPKPPLPLELPPRMGRPFSDNAVFQQQMPLPVWGWTLPGAEIQVTFGKQQRSAKAGADGRFEVKFDAMPADMLKSVDDAPAGHKLTVVTRAGGKQETKTFSNILIGEVWLCSGQSNMSVKYNSHGCNLYNKDGLPASPFSTCGY